VEVIENPLPYEVLRAASSSRLSQRAVEDFDDDDDNEMEREFHGEDGEQHDDDLAGALEMLPIPCTISCAPGLPAILLVNPPTDITGGPGVT